MKANWYYIEDDETLGPTTLEDLAGRIRHSGKSPLVWTQGMADWMDAEAVPALSQLLWPATRPSPTPLLPSNVAEPDVKKRATLRQRLGHELIEYLAISTYLFICFSALLFYKAAILRSDGIEYAPLGVAIVKALVLGKFVLVLHALKIGERKSGAGVLATDIVKKSVLFLLFLCAMSVAEELIVGFFHGREIRDIAAEIGGGTLPQAIAQSVLLLLILIPYFTFRVVSVRLGEGVLWKLLTEPAPVASPRRRTAP